MFTKFVVVLLIGSASNFRRLLDLAITVRKALFKNSDIYPNPSPTLTQLDTQIDALKGFIADVDGGNHAMKGLRDGAAVVLYELLEKEIIYVNQTASPNKGLLQLSGFPVRKEPTPKAIPGQVVIKKIEAGKENHTAKIKINPMGMTGLTFIVETTLTPLVPSSWKIVLLTSSSRKLLLADLAVDVKFYTRISAKNSSGTGLVSVPVPFTPQE